MKTYDVLIKGGMVFPLHEVRDIGIKDGQVAALGKDLDVSKATQIIDARGRTVSPAFVDADIDILNSFLSDDDDTTDLLSASIRKSNTIRDTYQGWRRAAIVKDILERAEETVEMCVKNGTAAIKTDISFSPIIGTAALDAVQELKRRYKDYIVIMSSVKFDPAFEKEWRAAAENGEIDTIGGSPHYTLDPDTGFPRFTADFKAGIDRAFELAQEYGLPIDLDCDSPDMDLFSYVAGKTLEYQLQNRITCAHATGLGAKGVDEDSVAAAVAWCAKAKIHISSMTSCSMYLEGGDRRGPTRVRQLLDAGVNVSIASGNIRNPLHPFGCCDLLEEALLTAQVHKFGTTADLLRVFDMITFNPAKNLLLERYGVWPGCDADLVILDTPNAAEAVLSQAKRLYTLHKGRTVAENGTILWSGKE